MTTADQITQKAQEVRRLERKLAHEKLKARKAKTRRKIEWGGLVVKANMDDYPKDIILGALIRAREELENDSGARSLYQSIGQAAFVGYD